MLVHGGMAQDVGPILEMVTEKYLLRSEAEWQGRQEAISIFDEVVATLRQGDIARIGALTQRNFDGPMQTIIPWASNHYTESLIAQVRREFGDGFRGFWMLGGMAGGGMGFLFEPRHKARAQERLQEIMSAAKRRLEGAVPFAMEPVVYDFTINEAGTTASLLASEAAMMPPGYYTLTVPGLIRQDLRLLSPSRRAELEQFGFACRTAPELSGMVETMFDRLLPHAASDADTHASSLSALLAEHGFDPVQHEQIRADLRSGRIGLAQNRLSVSVKIEDARAGRCDRCDGRFAGVLPRGRGRRDRRGRRRGGLTGRLARAAAGPRAPVSSRRSTPSAGWVAGTATSSRSTSPRAAARAGCTARSCRTSSPPAT